MTVTHDQQSSDCADTEKKEAIFSFRMVWVVHEEGVLVGEDRFALLEGNAVLSLVNSILGFVPKKPQPIHSLNVVTVYLHVKFTFVGERSV